MMFQDLFVYIAIPALATMYTLYKPQWHDVATVIWAVFALFKLSELGPLWCVLGVSMTVIHGSVALRAYRNKRLIRTV